MTSADKKRAAQLMRQAASKLSESLPAYAAPMPKAERDKFYEDMNDVADLKRLASLLMNEASV